MNLVEFVNMNGAREISTHSSPSASALKHAGLTVPDTSLPVSVDTSDWVTLKEPERLYRKFVFSKPSHVSYFVNQLLKYQDQTYHHSKITISHLDVEVETYTHDVNLVTESDIQLARFCDEIYEDTRFLRNDRR